jgi:hypothetical protein
MDAGITRIEAQQGFLTPDERFAREGCLAVKDAWLVHAAQSFLCIP